MLGAWEIEAPAPVVAALQLGMDEAVDGLMADDLVSNIAREAPRHLLGRPALREPVEDSLAQGIVALQPGRSEEHTSELQSLMRNSYAVFCLKKKKNSIL